MFSLVRFQFFDAKSDFVLLSKHVAHFDKRTHDEDISVVSG
jgi:hypothetical protein